MKIIAFKIWYSDEVYESKVGDYNEWVNSPDQDIQKVMFYFDKKDGMGRPTRRTMSGCDYYARTKKDELSQDFDDITKVKGHIKYGAYTDWDNLMKIMEEGINDYGEVWLYLDKPKVVIEEKIIIKTDLRRS